MVARSSNYIPEEEREDQSPPCKWASIPASEVIENGYRLEASVYGIEGRQARRDLEQCRWPLSNLCGDDGLATSYSGPRFKRMYVEKSAFPLYQPAQINDLYPKPYKYISASTQTDIDALRVKKGQVLLTCSGTIGNCAYVRSTLDGLIFSHDVIRIEPKEQGGFIYAFLKTEVGSAIINTSNYGAVIQHIEPTHLNQIRIPNPPFDLKQKIHNSTDKSFALRDESNRLMDEAQALIKDALQLPSIEKLRKQAKQFDKSIEALNYIVSSDDLDGRLDASYHVPVVRTIEQRLKKKAKRLLKVGNRRISQAVIFPGRFKRVYVEEGNGVIFIGGKQIGQLDPNNKKYLSLKRHADRIRDQLTLRENMVAITCSGTVGKVAIVPKHWDGWTANQHIIRIAPSNNKIAGYLYAWLSSDYAYPLIRRYIYGSTIDEIDDKQVSEITIPLLRDESVQTEINNKVLQANRKRTEAYELEQEAVDIFNKEVIYA